MNGQLKLMLTLIEQTDVLESVVEMPNMEFNTENKVEEYTTFISDLEIIGMAKKSKKDEEDFDEDDDFDDEDFDEEDFDEEDFDEEDLDFDFDDDFDDLFDDEDDDYSDDFF